MMKKLIIMKMDQLMMMKMKKLKMMKMKKLKMMKMKNLMMTIVMKKITPGKKNNYVLKMIQQRYV
jgi:hypothetical protein